MMNIAEGSPPKHANWRFCFRLFVCLMWMVILEILWFPRPFPKSIALAAFAIFKVTAVAGIAFLLIEVADTNSGVPRRLAKLIFDAVLILPMFVFWFLAAAASL